MQETKWGLPSHSSNNQLPRRCSITDWVGCLAIPSRCSSLRAFSSDYQSHDTRSPTGLKRSISNRLTTNYNKRKRVWMLRLQYMQSGRPLCSPPFRSSLDASLEAADDDFGDQPPCSW